eukprot:TRINITY_DN17239_c0_g1_i1.p1 TRINITY_DN17239_c0_g1~~TRINITY_DN17239_c0_g1_i1.p1  ORF type:complete len:317 (-),score=60.82 TRINITY_DN17239_c0_g1_i1:190-1140(-)
MDLTDSDMWYTNVYWWPHEQNAPATTITVYTDETHFSTIEFVPNKRSNSFSGEDYYALFADFQRGALAAGAVDWSNVGAVVFSSAYYAGGRELGGFQFRSKRDFVPQTTTVVAGGIYTGRYGVSDTFIIPDGWNVGSDGIYLDNFCTQTDLIVLPAGIEEDEILFGCNCAHGQEGKREKREGEEVESYFYCQGDGKKKREISEINSLHCPEGKFAATFNTKKRAFTDVEIGHIAFSATGLVNNVTTDDPFMEAIDDVSGITKLATDPYPAEFGSFQLSPPTATGGWMLFFNPSTGVLGSQEVGGSGLVNFAQEDTL